MLLVLRPLLIPVPLFSQSLLALRTIYLILLSFSTLYLNVAFSVFAEYLVR